MHYSSSIRSHSMSRRTISSDAALLKQHGFKIVSTDVGGAHHRKIYLELWNGDVWVQRGRPTPLISREAGGMVAKRIMSSSPSRGDRMSEWPSRNLAAGPATRSRGTTTDHDLSSFRKHRHVADHSSRHDHRPRARPHRQRRHNHRGADARIKRGYAES